MQSTVEILLSSIENGKIMCLRVDEGRGQRDIYNLLAGGGGGGGAP